MKDHELITKSRADRAGSLARRFINSDVDLDDGEILKVAADIQAWRQWHAYPLSLITPGIRNWVGRATGGSIVVGQRLKRLPQIVDKLDRFPSMRLSQMEDIAGCRAVLPNEATVEVVAAKIAQYWHVREISDYRREGKPRTGYRGLHCIVERRGRLAEVQLRTPGQQDWAEAVERTASRTGYALKDGDGPTELVEYFAVASALIWLLEADLPADEGLRARLANLRPQASFLRATRRIVSRHVAPALPPHL